MKYGCGIEIAASAAEGLGGAGRLVIDAAEASDAELQAASAVAKLGRGPVVIRDPIPGRATSDLLIDATPDHIYTQRPQTRTGLLAR